MVEVHTLKCVVTDRLQLSKKELEAYQSVDCDELLIKRL
jgi:hypothetical protein